MYSQRKSPIETLGSARPGLRLPMHIFLCITLFTLCSVEAAREAGQLPRDLTQLSLEQLMDIEVTTASRKKQKLSETPAAAYVITSDEIRRSTATSVPELLRQVPGLYVARIDANKWAISARGLNGRYANKLLVLVDGRSIYIPLFSGVYWEMQDTLLEDIERIEVIRGPGASMWGGNAVNGVINIITKRAEDTQGGLLTVASGTEQRGIGGIRYGVKIFDDAHLRVFGKYTRRDNALLSTGLPAQDRSRGARGGFRLDFQESAKDQFTVQGDVYDWQGDHMLLVPMMSPPYSSQIGARQAFSGSNVLARWNRVLSSASNLEFQFYFDRSELDHAGLKEKRDTLDFDFQHRFWLGDFNEVIWGLGYRRSNDDLTSSFVYTFQPDRRNDDSYSAFVQDDVHLFSDTVRLTLGTKFEGVSFGYPDGTPDYEKLTIQPNVRFMWLPTADHAFWGAVSGAVRNPSRADHDMRISAGVIPPFVEVNPSPLPALVTILGNRAFQPEHLRAYELGYRAMVTEEFSVDVTGFYNLYDRLREAAA